MLAMKDNDNGGYLTPRGALGFFASKLAPTQIGCTQTRHYQFC
jgi:hypothetical protein